MRSSIRIASTEGMVKVEIRSAVVGDTYIVDESVGGGRKITGTVELYEEKRLMRALIIK